MENRTRTTISDESSIWDGLRTLQHTRTDADVLPEGGLNDTGLEDVDSRHMDFEDEYDEEFGEKPAFTLPPWMRYVTWALIVFTNVFVSYWIILYGLSFGASTSWSWLRSLMFSIFTSVLVIQPLQVLLFALLLAYIYRRHNDHADPDDDFDDETVLESKNTGLVSEWRRRRRYYKPRRHARRPADIRVHRARRLQEIKVVQQLKEAMLYLLFFWMLCCIIYADFDENVAIFAGAIRRSLGVSDVQLVINGTAVQQFTEAVTQAQWWSWLQDGFAPRLFWDEMYNGDPSMSEGFMGSGTIALLGGIQLRQLRVGAHTCDIPSVMTSLVSSCYAEWSEVANDMDTFGLGNQSGDVYGPPGRTWDYHTADENRLPEYLGIVNTYPGAGFVQLLPGTYDEMQALLADLYNGDWTDQQTRVVFAELSVYNANINLFAAIELVGEFLPTGDVIPTTQVLPMRLYRYAGSRGTFLMASEVVFVFLLAYYTYLEVVKLRRMGWQYFVAFRNWLDLTIALLSWFATAFEIFRIVYVTETVSNFANQGRAQFAADFHWIAHWDRIVRMITAVLLFISTLKFLVVLRHNKVIRLLTRVLTVAMTQLVSFLVVITILWMGFVVWSYSAFGNDLESFSTFYDSMFTLMRVTLGDFTFSDYQSTNRVLGPIFFLLYAWIFYVMVSNFFIAILSGALWEVTQMDEEEPGLSISDYLIERIRWYTGFSLGGPRKRHRKENVADMCEEALARMDQMDAKIDSLFGRGGGGGSVSGGGAIGGAQQGTSKTRGSGTGSGSGGGRVGGSTTGSGLLLSKGQISGGSGSGVGIGSGASGGGGGGSGGGASGSGTIGRRKSTNQRSTNKSNSSTGGKTGAQRPMLKQPVPKPTMQSVHVFGRQQSDAMTHSSTLTASDFDALMASDPIFNTTGNSAAFEALFQNAEL